MSSGRHNEHSINSRIMAAIKRKTSPPPRPAPVDAGSLDLGFMINDFLPGCASMRTTAKKNAHAAKQPRKDSESPKPSGPVDVAKVQEEIAAKRQKLIEALKTPVKAPAVQAASKGKEAGKAAKAPKKSPPPTVEETTKQRNTTFKPVQPIPPPITESPALARATIRHQPVMPDSYPVNNPSVCSSVHGRKTVSVREQQELQMARRKEVIARLKEEKAAKAPISSTPTPKQAFAASTTDNTDNKPSRLRKPVVVVGFRSTARIGFMYENEDQNESETRIPVKS